MTCNILLSTAHACLLGKSFCSAELARQWQDGWTLHFDILLQESLQHSITKKEDSLQNLTSQLTKHEATRADEQAMHETTASSVVSAYSCHK